MGTGVFRQAWPLRWHEIAYLFRQPRIADVENSQARIEIGDVDQIARLLHRGIMDFLIGVVRPKASALVAEILITRIFRRHRSWKNGDEARLRRIAVIDHPGEVHAVVAAALIHRFRAYIDE